MSYQLGFMSPTPNVTRFLILIIGIYLLFAIFGNTFFGAYLYSKMVLDPYRTVFSYEIWRAVTYAFLHDASSPMHVIFNALLLYMIGPQLEDRWGEKRFLIFSFTAIILGALMVIAAFLLGIGGGIVVGFSAVTVGLLVAWGLAYPDQQIYLLGILPLSGKAMVYITVGLEILYAFSNTSTSSAAHFGGILTAFIFSFGLYKPQRIRQMWRQAKMKQNLRRIK
ncbi:MAG: rhomboid family intramembrane serine protease [Myxococcales bacterium]|nr:rhomboid family intramembrane serine protease [Myxococcales bacterium]USN51115.1 MAG: rhomboid family intramembrane serine protease [Myxococcales bacterium]